MPKKLRKVRRRVRCPKCRYNIVLKGSNRCPFCGHAFRGAK
jgi:DNA-directed RNA polymerase subunit RPC12/RpoP